MAATEAQRRAAIRFREAFLRKRRQRVRRLMERLLWGNRTQQVEARMLLRRFYPKPANWVKKPCKNGKRRATPSEAVWEHTADTDAPSTAWDVLSSQDDTRQ